MKKKDLNKNILFKKVRYKKDNKIYILSGYTKNFFAKNNCKLFDPENYNIFWVNNKDIEIIEKES